MKKIVTTLLVLVAIVLTFTTYKHIRPITWNNHASINQDVFSDRAIEGYDPVAYFTKNKAIAGNEAYAYVWNDATWYFSSSENMEMYKSNPTLFTPQFGGYCSYAVSTGFTAKIDPEAFEVIDGKLYLFNDQNFRTKWNEDREGNMKKDNDNWSKSK